MGTDETLPIKLPICSQRPFRIAPTPGWVGHASISQPLGDIFHLLPIKASDSDHFGHGHADLLALTKFGGDQLRCRLNDILTRRAGGAVRQSAVRHFPARALRFDPKAPNRPKSTSSSTLLACQAKHLFPFVSFRLRTHVVARRSRYQTSGYPLVRSCPGVQQVIGDQVASIGIMRRYLDARVAQAHRCATHLPSTRGRRLRTYEGRRCDGWLVSFSIFCSLRMTS